MLSFTCCERWKPKLSFILNIWAGTISAWLLILEKVIPDPFEVGKSLLGGSYGSYCFDKLASDFRKDLRCHRTRNSIYALISIVTIIAKGIMSVVLSQTRMCIDWLTSTIFVCRGGHTCCLSWPRPFTRCIRTIGASLRLSYCPTHYLKIPKFLIFYQGTKGVQNNICTLWFSCHFSI